MNENDKVKSFLVKEEKKEKNKAVINGKKKNSVSKQNE